MQTAAQLKQQEEKQQVASAMAAALARRAQLQQQLPPQQQPQQQHSRVPSKIDTGPVSPTGTASRQAASQLQSPATDPTGLFASMRRTTGEAPAAPADPASAAGVQGSATAGQGLGKPVGSAAAGQLGGSISAAPSNPAHQGEGSGGPASRPANVGGTFGFGLAKTLADLGIQDSPPKAAHAAAAAAGGTDFPAAAAPRMNLQSSSRHSVQATPAAVVTALSAPPGVERISGGSMPSIIAAVVTPMMSGAPQAADGMHAGSLPQHRPLIVDHQATSSSTQPTSSSTSATPMLLSAGLAVGSRAGKSHESAGQAAPLSNAHSAGLPNHSQSTPAVPGSSSLQHQLVQDLEAQLQEARSQLAAAQAQKAIAGVAPGVQGQCKVVYQHGLLSTCSMLLCITITCETRASLALVPQLSR